MACLIGAHTSSAGGLYQALLEGKRIGATTIQFFTSNQKRWASPPLAQETLDLWHQTLQQTQLQKIMSHDSYLINLGCPDPINLEKSRQAFQAEVIRCLQLGIDYLNFHPGAALQEDEQRCLDRICESLLLYQKQLEGGKLRLLLETTAGQGSCVGHRFEHLAYIIDRVKAHLPIGICIDTCHLFAAGYEVRTAEGWDATLKAFDQIVGLQHLYAFHLNDSLKSLGCRVDRHQPLGQGCIGLDCFRFLMQDCRTKHLPKYLETPGGPDLWVEEIKLLQGWAASVH